MALLAELGDGAVHPAQPLHVFRVHADPHAHAGLADPDVLGFEIVLQGEVLEQRIVDTQQAGKAVGPHGVLVEGLGHGIEAVDYQVDLAALHVEEADVTGRHDVEADARSFLAQLGQQCR